ncbi:UDP-glucuronosyl/UDP-glucosyltransferase [Artemisia annua]|uniref:UDP-glucuronosyl/UDP-glucosyltransferase n=1 Tax=Artemisia annua TaxID=35608 RepID=A0A2U1P2F5_ARTAN|nr:UDP-glucuronosyl/UDP-glucosyltransferase [Artemisia annua]
MDNHEGEATKVSTEPKLNNHHWCFFRYPFKATSTLCFSWQTFFTKDFKITIIHTEFNSPYQSNYPRFTFKSISDGLPKYKDEIMSFLTGNNIGNFMKKLHWPVHRLFG